MMLIVFLGNAVPDSDFADFLKHNPSRGLAQADNEGQLGLLESLSKIPNTKIINLSPLYKSDNPKYKDQSRYQLLPDVTTLAFSADSSNKYIFYLKETLAYWKALKILQQNFSEPILITCYGFYFWRVIPAVLAKRKFKSYFFPIIGIVRSPASLLINIVTSLALPLVKYADGFFEFTQSFAKDVIEQRWHKPFALIHDPFSSKIPKLYRSNRTKGINQNNLDARTNPNCFSICYTGSLIEYAGAKILLDLIQSSKNQYQWEICGNGPLANEFQKLALSSQYNVNFHGFVSNTEAIKYQVQSSLIISLRPTNTKAQKYLSKYTASGKNYSYLLSGTPLLASNVGSINPALRPFMVFPKDNTTCEILSTIERVKNNYNHYESQASKAIDFVEKNFTSGQIYKSMRQFLESFPQLESQINPPEQLVQ